MFVRSGLIRFLSSVSSGWGLLWFGLVVAWVLLSIPAAEAGNVNLAWDAPTTNSDGTPLTDLLGYRVYWGTSPGSTTAPCNGNYTLVGNVPTHRLMGLVTGTTYFIRVTAVDFSGNVSECSNEVAGVAQADPLNITTTSLPGGTVGSAYSQTLAATGGTAPYTWTSGTLPPGLTLNSSTGILSGTPTTVGTFNFTVQVMDSLAATDTQSLSLSVSTTPPPPPAPSAAAGGGCFIATAAYGSALEPQVVLLQAFRDRYLVSNPPGRAFVRWYYRTSPPIAARIRESPILRGLARAALWPLVGIAWLTLHPAAGAAVLGGIGGVGGWLRSRRKRSPRAPA